MAALHLLDAGLDVVDRDERRAVKPLGIGLAKVAHPVVVELEGFLLGLDIVDAEQRHAVIREQDLGGDAVGVLIAQAQGADRSRRAAILRNGTFGSCSRRRGGSSCQSASGSMTWASVEIIFGMAAACASRHFHADHGRGGGKSAPVPPTCRRTSMHRLVIRACDLSDRSVRHARAERVRRDQSERSIRREVFSLGIDARASPFRRSLRHRLA